MKPQRFTADAAPLREPPRRGDALREWCSAMLPILALGGLLAGFWLLYQAMMTPVALPAMTTSPDSSESSVPSTYPPELLTMARAVSTSLAPTPTATLIPYKTPTVGPTATIPVWCGMNSQPGETCTWPQPTPTLPTPIPICETPIPTADCRWMRSRAGMPLAGVR